jgi:hypothetical protein
MRPYKRRKSKLNQLKQIQITAVSGGIIGGGKNPWDLSTTPPPSQTPQGNSPDTYEYWAQQTNDSIAGTPDNRTTGTAIGAIAGATLCTGLAVPSGGTTVPAVPYCAAAGGFVGGLVGGSSGTSAQGHSIGNIVAP